MPKHEIKPVDLRILSRLQEDGRMTNQALSEQIGLSPSPCLRRVRQLEEAGVITGYVAL
ncbi:Lrp/AsnC family transcriptional regulator, partial [Streptomyces galilaeus]|uniref:Lrp/AsnC family transcriptional regulator n=1 Tax=Streptomyces galilaeus TaxID=33899 RepID=UPI0038F6969E